MTSNGLAEVSRSTLEDTSHVRTSPGKSTRLTQLAEEKSSSATVSCPSDARRFARLDPTNPAAPVTRMRIAPPEAGILGQSGEATNCDSTPGFDVPRCDTPRQNGPSRMEAHASGIFPVGA